MEQTGRVQERRQMHVNGDVALPAFPGATRVLPVMGRHPAWRETCKRTVVIVEGHTDLLEVVDALHAPRGLTGRLNGRQEQADQQPGDGDNHQELDEGEGTA